MRSIKCPPEYDVLVAHGNGRYEVTGYVLVALRRELDWHKAVRRTYPESAGTTTLGRAATVCELAIRDKLARWLDFEIGSVDELLDSLRDELARDTMRPSEELPELAIDPELLPYRKDAAARVALIVMRAGQLTIANRDRTQL